MAEPDYVRLIKCVQHSREELSGARSLRLEFLRQYVGKHYGGKNTRSKARVPLNHLKNAVDVWMANLAGGVPRMLVTTDVGELKPLAADLEAIVNHELRMMNYERETNRAIFDAMLGFGIIKTGMEQIGVFDLGDGTQLPVGAQRVWCVDADNWVHDTTAKRPEELGFCGDRITMRMDEARARWPELRGKDIDKIDRSTNRDGGDERPSTVSGMDMEIESYRDMIEVYELWIPDEQMIVTCLERGHDGKPRPLETRKWTGDDAGPYHMLLLDEVPQNILPLPPVATIFDTHELQNQTYIKIANQVRRQKTVTAIRGAAKEDGDRVVKASDGQGILVDDPKSAIELNFGGPDQRNLAFLLMNQQLGSYYAGNIDALGGLAAQSGTVGQEELIKQSANVRMGRMADKTALWHDGLGRVIGKAVYVDPIRQYRTTRPAPVPGLSPVPVHFSADRREGDFLDFNFKLALSSMKRSTPGTQLSEMMTVLQTFAPFMPLLEQQGIGLNMESNIKNIAHLLDNPYVKEMFTFTGAPQGEPSKMRGTTGGSTAPRATGRGNGSEATPHGQREAQIQALLGSTLQPKQQQRMYG